MGNKAMETTTEKELTIVLQESLKKPLAYPDYRKMVAQLAKTNDTTGTEQTEAYIQYTQLNDRRMNRWDKTLKFSAETVAQLKAVDRSLLFLVLTESWCGDAAPSMPVMHKINETNPNIEMRLVLRNENPALMERFLTNGAKSIPKLILMDKETLEVLGDWGPRPKIATQMVQDYKAKHGKLTAEFRQELQQWYNKDKGQEILKELAALLTLK